jgi:hypothetical protein
MARARPKGLTHKQAAFAAEYVHTNGNGTKAAKRAGYADSSAHVRASELVRKSKVTQRISYLSRRHEISAERVLTRLDNLSLGAEEAGNHSAAIKAEELLGKSLGMWIDRSMSVNVDMSEAHLDALRSLMGDRKQGDRIPTAGNGNTVRDTARAARNHATDVDPLPSDDPDDA